MRRWLTQTARSRGFQGAPGIDLPCFSNDSLVELLEVSYDTAPMADDFYINGPIEADVWLSTTSADVGSSDFPHGLPPLPDAVDELPGILTIRSDATHPSSVVLPKVGS